MLSLGILLPALRKSERQKTSPNDVMIISKRQHGEIHRYLRSPVGNLPTFLLSLFYQDKFSHGVCLPRSVLAKKRTSTKEPSKNLAHCCDFLCYFWKRVLSNIVGCTWKKREGYLVDQKGIAPGLPVKSPHFIFRRLAL